MSRSRAVLSTILVLMAILFAIPGTIENWYPRKGNHAVTESNPPLLVVGQSISLAFNVAALVIFLLRVSGYETLRYIFVCSITLFGALLLKLLCFMIFFTSPSNPIHDGLSPAFHLAMTSAILTSIAFLASVFDSRDAKKHPRLQMMLSPNQRNLAIVSFQFMVYLVIGTIMFKYLLEITSLDAIYFVMTTTLTVGYGDILPTSLASKIFSLFYFPIGITLVVMLISLIRVTALTSVNARFVRGLQAAKRRRKEALMKRHVEADAAVRHGEMATGEQCDIPNDELDVDGWRATEDHESYEKMLKAAAYKHNHAYTPEILLSSIAFMISWVVGAIVLKELEGWSFFTAFYFMFISYASIGFGDYTPTTPGARAFYIAWGATGIVVLTVLISLIAEAWSTRYSNMLRKLVIRRHRTLQSMDVEKAGDGGANATPPHISTLPSGQSPILNDVLVPGNRVPPDIVREDLNILEQDITDCAPPIRLKMDFKRLLDDCEECLLALLNDDYDRIRKNLSKVLYERDRISDPETGKTLLKQEEDDIVKLMLLRHIHYEIVDIKRNVTLRKES